MDCSAWIVLGCLFVTVHGWRNELSSIYDYHEGKKIRLIGMEKRIVGGVDFPIAAFPYIAQISALGRPHCGGVIVSQRVILTAAHCFKNKLENYPCEIFKVHVGSSTTLAGTSYSVCRSVSHRNYYLDKFKNYYYDLGLMLLTKKIVFGKFVQRAKLATDYKWRHPKYTFSVAGFGYISSTGTVSQKLKLTRMRYVGSKICNETQSWNNVYGATMPVPNHMFCMISATWNSDCFGDSGSAVTWKGLVVGIVATGRDASCGSESMPSLYIDVVYFRRWISVNVQALEAIPLGKCNCTSSIKGQKLRLTDNDYNKIFPGFFPNMFVNIHFDVPLPFGIQVNNMNLYVRYFILFNLPSIFYNRNNAFG